MKFKTFINETKTEIYVVFTKAGAGLVEVAYTDHPDKNAGFSKGTVLQSKLNDLMYVKFDEPIMINKETKNKIDALLHVEAQKQIHK